MALVINTQLLYWVVTFFVVSLVAAAFGFGLVSSASAGVAKVIFFIFVTLFVLSLVWMFLGPYLM